MKYQIDQSGKIEQTERDTVISLINGDQATILLKKAEKRKIQKVFKIAAMQKVFPSLLSAQLKQRALSEYRFWQQGKHKLTERSEGICEGQIFPLDKIKRVARLSLSRVSGDSFR